MNRIYKCFPGGKFKVLTLSYDDGKLEDKRLVDIFNKNGIRATFNVNSGLTDMPIRLPACIPFSPAVYRCNLHT